MKQVRTGIFYLFLNVYSVKPKHLRIRSIFDLVNLIKKSSKKGVTG